MGNEGYLDLIRLSLKELDNHVVEYSEEANSWPVKTGYNILNMMKNNIEINKELGWDILESFNEFCAIAVKNFEYTNFLDSIFSLQDKFVNDIPKYKSHVLRFVK